MPVQIGAKTHNFADPTGLLSDCHRRIEMFLGSMEAVAKEIDRPPSEEAKQALTAALRYFAQAAPKHTADEEESLFPRLRRVENPEVQAAFAKLETLEHDHRFAEPLHAEVERLGEQYLEMGKLSEKEVAQFRDALARLAAMYRHHIDVEDTVIFPLATQTLSNAEKAAIAQEMADRRKVPLVVDIGKADF